MERIETSGVQWRSRLREKHFGVYCTSTWFFGGVLFGRESQGVVRALGDGRLEYVLMMI